MKSFSIPTIVAVIAGLFGAPAFASGFRCESRDGVNVKVYNHINPQDGTRVPAVFVVSTDAKGTILVAKGKEISKKLLTRVTQYSVESRKAGLEHVILQVYFKEGRDYLAKNERVKGNLIYGAAGVRQVKPLVCSRYLKH